MLSPRSSTHRTVLALDGLWDITFSNGDSFPTAVPGSWNSQHPAHRDDLDPVIYRTSFWIPTALSGSRLRLWFGSVNYEARVSIDGAHVGSHIGGHLPFEFDVSELAAGHHSLAVGVDAALRADRVPPGDLPPGHGFQAGGWPPAAFDFFPYGGIQRSVLLESSDHLAVETITVDPLLDGHVRLGMSGPAAPRRCRVIDPATDFATDWIDVDAEGLSEGVAWVQVPSPRHWCPADPHLYIAEIETLRDDVVADSVQQRFGIREVRVNGDQLLLNGEPITLRGFGRHEDAPAHGRGASNAHAVLDHDRMTWCGANSYRTTHYPYDEAQLDLADELGFLVVSETPAVGLYFVGPDQEQRAEIARQQLRELIARDRRHPSVIMWSLANEPVSEPRPERSLAFFEGQHALAKRLDPTRPTTVAGWQMVDEPSFGIVDVISVNRYFGWYTEPGRIAEGAAAFAAELDSLHERFSRPILVSEFGADALAGHHADPPEMWSEEYQAEFLSAYLDVIDARSWVVGAHVWNLCDFRTSQGITRAGAMNHKGVFTQDRRPKAAAHELRRRWKLRPGS